MNTIIVIADVVSTVAFLAAACLAAFTPIRSELMSRSVRIVFVAAMGLYVFVGVSNILEHAGITAAFDVYEDFAELLFFPALAYVASTMVQNRALADQANSARLMQQQNDLLLSIVDTVPGGFLVVGPTGAITFANEGAERLLDMTSDTGGSVSITPSWTLHDPVTADEITLAQIASGMELSRKPLFARWPDGTQTEFLFSSTPMKARSGELGGSIIAFEAASHRG